MALIKLTQNKSALVDDSEFSVLNKYKWYYSHGYAMRDTKNGRVYMHSFICPSPKGKQTDHINRNKLDNRKENLRSVTISENKMNTGLWKHNTSGYKGVSIYTRYGTWRAQIKINRRVISLGFFKNKLDAVEARRKAELLYFSV